MASRYTQEYFFHYMLMNVSFTDLNEIIHPQAEDIPEYIRHLCQCYVCKLFILGWFKESRRWFENGGTYPRLY